LPSIGGGKGGKGSF
jgi:hypothetical protein